MKKMFAALCALLLAPTMASAELISITELVQEMPEAWIEEIDVNGKTISIDAPIYVPEVETLPVLKVTMIEANDDAVQAYVNDGWKVVEGYPEYRYGVRIYKENENVSDENLHQHEYEIANDYWQFERTHDLDEVYAQNQEKPIGEFARMMEKGFNDIFDFEETKLYEIAPVFDVSARKPGDLPHEQPSLCIGAYGDGVDFYLIRDIVIDMLSQFGVQAKIVPGAEPYHHPGRAARLMVGDRCIATVAELHPNVMQAFEITRRTIIAEVNLEMLCELHTKVGHVRALPKFPAVTRDIALVMEEGTTVGSVLDVIRKTGGALLEKAEMFDIYRGAQLLSGRKSVAFSLTFRNAERTLSDDDVNPLMQKILAACEAECNATLRL